MFVGGNNHVRFGGDIHELIGNVEQFDGGIFPERHHFDAFPELLRETQNRHEIAVATDEHDDVGVRRGAHNIGRDAHVPIAVFLHSAIVIDYVHAQEAAFHAVAKGTEFMEKTVRGGITFALHHVRGGVRELPTANRAVQQLLVIDVAVLVIPRGVVNILRINKQRYSLLGVIPEECATGCAHARIVPYDSSANLVL